MTDDLQTRLRACTCPLCYDLAQEAAAEIERLRQQNPITHDSVTNVVAEFDDV